MIVNNGETRDVERTITMDQLPYEFYGEVFGEDTEEGVYKREVTVSASDGCTATINLTLTVGEPGVDGLNGAAIQSLVPDWKPLNRRAEAICP